MPNASLLTKDPRYQRLAALCMQLPEALGNVNDDYADFRVRGKPFAYFLVDHDNDGITSLCCRSAQGENVDRSLREPERFYLPRYIGKKGWFGLRLDRGRIDWQEVRNLLELSYCLAAPARLVKQLQLQAPPET